MINFQIYSKRETINEKMKFDYFHKRQTGGHGEYGRVAGYIEPIRATEENIDRMNSIEIFDKTSGTDLPKKYIPAIKKGMLKALKKGSVAGQQVAAISIYILEGDHHIVDSNDNSMEKTGN